MMGTGFAKGIKRPTFNYSMGIFRISLLLIVISLIMVYSSSVGKLQPYSEHNSYLGALNSGGQPERSHNIMYLQKQLIWAVLGVGVMLFFASLRYSYLRQISWLMIGVSIVLLLLVLGSPPINGARRWIVWGPFSVQPSEFARLSIVLFMATFISNHGDRLERSKLTLAQAILWLGLVVGLIFIEPDFGASFVIAVIVMSMWFTAGFKKSHLLGLMFLGGIALSAMLVSDEYRRERLLAFWDPEKHLQGAGWQAYLSLVALGSGGTRGVGLGASMQKFRFQQEAHTDFILSIIGEETGLVGLTVLMLIYLALIAMAFRVAYQCPDYFGMLVAFGLAMMIALPTILNIAVVSSSMPTKGIALPLISYGGSSMLVNCAAIGILMNIGSANFAQHRLSAT